MTIPVRKMLKTDCTVWAGMRFQLWDSLSVEGHRDEIKRMLSDKKHIGYIALLPHEEPAGFAEISIRDYAAGCASQPVPFLEGIWVAAKYRRQGIGRALIAKIAGDLLLEGYRELCSDAEIRNRRSHLAHRNWGFNETERVVYFRKPLG